MNPFATSAVASPLCVLQGALEMQPRLRSFIRARLVSTGVGEGRTRAGDGHSSSLESGDKLKCQRLSSSAHRLRQRALLRGEGGGSGRCSLPGEGRSRAGGPRSLGCDVSAKTFASCGLGWGVIEHGTRRRSYERARASLPKLRDGNRSAKHGVFLVRQVAVVGRLCS